VDKKNDYWEVSNSGLFRKKIGEKVYEFEGKLLNPLNCINIAFLVHPLDRNDFSYISNDEKTISVMKKYNERETMKWNEEINNAINENRKLNYKKKPNFISSLYNNLGNKIIGDIIVNTNNKILYGILIMIPYLPDQYMEALDRARDNDNTLLEKIVNSIIAAANIAKESNCDYLGWGAYNSIIGQNISINHNNEISLRPRRKEVFLDDLKILPSTSGNDLTAAGIAEGIKIIANKKNIDIKKSTVVNVGGSGSVGAAASQIIHSQLLAKKSILVARNLEKLKKIKKICEEKYNLKNIEISDNIQDSIKKGDIINFAISGDINLTKNWFKPNVIICDASQPQVIDTDLINQIPGATLLNGSIFQIPGIITGYEFLRMGQSNQSYGCLAATITRGLIGIKKSAGNGIYIDPDESLYLLKEAVCNNIKPIDIKIDSKLKL